MRYDFAPFIIHLAVVAFAAWLLHQMPRLDPANTPSWYEQTTMLIAIVALLRTFPKSPSKKASEGEIT